MATISDMTTGEYITEGLEGCTVSDQALRAARRIAADRGASVLLSDDDGNWRVDADGSCMEVRVGSDGVARAV